ncbi:MFS transporter [Pradoshia eiseniae]|uniref:MFS transporter n=1 Tax=Pradoshia eiseniae TaxID=2064768 RepID=A0A2S7MWZ1_9BACI|nr:MFS transporter [Pradoshia eiseniae]PQD94342.1 MFS transporter [Pradoshia eiseniae]
MQQKKKKIHFAWWVLLGLAIMMGVARGGINNAASLFLTPVSEDIGVGMGQLTLYLSVSSIAMMVFLPFAGKIMGKYDIRMILIVAILLQGGAFALFGMMNSVWGWYLLAIPLSVGSVLVTQLAGPVLINQWFKKRNGLALGIMMAASGLFGAIIQPNVGTLIASQGWRASYIIVGVAAIIIVIPVVLLFIRMSPQQKGLLPYGFEKAEGNDSNAAHTVEHKGVTAAVAKKSLAFYALLFFLFLITAVASFAQFIAPYAQSIGYDVQFAGNVMGVFMFGVLVGSLVFGFLTDKMGAKKTTFLSMFVGLISVFLLIFLPDNPLVFSVAIGLFGFVSSSVGTLGPLLTTSIFGIKEYGAIYGTAALGLAFAGITALPAYGFVFDATGSYLYVLYAVAAMILLSVLLIIIAFKGKETLEKAGHWD